jgi:hypothetical protein
MLERDIRPKLDDYRRFACVAYIDPFGETVVKADVSETSHFICRKADSLNITR